MDCNDNTLCIAGNWLTLDELFKKFEYEDGSPCGKLVEE